MNKMRTAAVVLACLVLAMAFVTGCSDLPASDVDDRAAVEEPTETPEPTEEPTEAPTEEPTEEPTESFLYNAYGSGESEVLFTNDTDYVFRSLEVQGPNDTEFGADLMTADASVQQGETFALNYTPLTAAEVTPDPEEEILFSDNIYNIRLTTDAGEEYVLYDCDLAQIDTAFIRWDEEGDVLYLEYKSVTSGDIVNTLEAQLFMKDFAAGAVDETPVQAAAAAADSAGSSGGSSHSSGSSGSSSGTSGSGASSSGGSGSGSAGSSGSSGSGSSGSSSDDSSSSGGDSSASSGGGDDWSSGDAGTDDCLEDNIIWND